MKKTVKSNPVVKSIKLAIFVLISFILTTVDFVLNGLGCPTISTPITILNLWVNQQIGELIGLESKQLIYKAVYIVTFCIIAIVTEISPQFYSKEIRNSKVIVIHKEVLQKAEKKAKKLAKECYEYIASKTDKS